MVKKLSNFFSRTSTRTTTRTTHMKS